MAAKSGPNRNRLRLNMTLTSETVLQKNRVARSIFSETNTPIAWIIATTTPLSICPGAMPGFFCDWRAPRLWPLATKRSELLDHAGRAVTPGPKARTSPAQFTATPVGKARIRRPAAPALLLPSLSGDDLPASMRRALHRTDDL